MIDGQGAKAINPGHDAESLSFAIRHQLPMDQYSINEKGRFTKLCGQFAGEKVTEFKDNVIHFLSDIGNLNKVQESTRPVYLNAYTLHPLEPLSKPYTTLSLDTLNTFHTSDSDDPDTLLVDTQSDSGHHNRESIMLSSYARSGCLLPLLCTTTGDRLVFSAQDFVQDATSPVLVFDLLIIHLALEGRLSQTFTVEQCITLLFSQSYAC